LVGAGIRRLIQRERIGAMSLCMFLHIRIILHDYIYFSIVLLNEPCAYLLNLSASLMTNILNFFADF
jgi:hypothetical protein